MTSRSLIGNTARALWDHYQALRVIPPDSKWEAAKPEFRRKYYRWAKNIVRAQSTGFAIKCPASAQVEE